MRTTTAYFAGIRTVIAAVAAGLGGGLLLGDIMSPQQPKHPSSEVTRLEQRSSQAPISAMNGASEPVPYLGTSQVAATIAEPQAPSPAEAPTQQAQPSQQQQAQPTQAQSPPPQQQQPQQQQAAAQPADTQPADSKPKPAAVQPGAATEPSAAKERAAPEDSFAKARDADLKRDARRAEDRRKAERRQQWATKRRIKPREDDELRDVEDKVRQVTEERPLYSRRSFDSEPGCFGSRINLFEQD